MAQPINKYTNYHKIQSIKTTNLGSLIKIKYDIILKENTSEKDVIDELRVKNGNLEIAICNAEINSELLIKIILTGCQSSCTKLCPRLMGFVIII